MKITHLNAQGIGNKVLAVKHLLQSFDIDFLCLTEVWSKNSVVIDGYKFYRNDRVSVRGGVGIMVKSHINIANYGKSNDDNVESIWIDIKNKNTFVRLVCCYCLPGVPLTQKAFHNFYIKGRTILCGDFNAKHTELHNPRHTVVGLPMISGVALVEIVGRSDLYLLSKGEATHTSVHGTSSQLDLFFCSDKLTTKTSDVEVLPDLTGSDHLPIMIHFNLIISEPAYPALRLNLRKANWAKFEKLVDTKVVALEGFVNRVHQDIFDEIDCLASGLTDAICHGRSGAIPCCQANKVHSTPINPELLAAIKIRRDLRRIYMRTGDRMDKTNYNRATNVVRNLSRKASLDGLKGECSSLNSHLYRSPRIFWRKIHNVMANCNVTSASASYPIKDKAGKPVLDDKIKADIFGSHLEKLFQVADGPEFNSKFKNGLEYVLKSFSNILCPTKDKNRVVDPMCVLTFDDVSLCIKNLFNKAPGHDNITNALLRHCPPSYIACLTRLFNLILKHGYIPKLWKFAHVVMIPKVGKDTSSVSGYRPISLLPSQPKVLERIMALRLLIKMQELNVIPDFQSAFQNKKCTNDHLFRLGQDISLAKKNGEETVICCLDNQGAFDCAWPDAIRMRLIECSFPSDFIRYSSNFMTDRTLSVRIGASFSSIRKAKAGVPQGSSLSPHFYNLLVSNIFTKHPLVHVKVGHFADDIALWASDKFRSRAVDRVNVALDQVSDWMSIWRQRLNPTKSQAMIFTTKGTPAPGSTPLKIREIVLKWQEFVIYLGVRYDRTLSWKPQFEHLSSVFSSRLRLLRKLCYNEFGISPHVALIIYKSFIRPVIEYGCPAFLCLQKYQIDRLQVLQNTALRLALRAPNDTPLIELHRTAKVQFVHTHMKIRAADFILRAMENDTLSGREAKYYLNMFSSEELAGTPLGHLRNLIA